MKRKQILLALLLVLLSIQAQASTLEGLLEEVDKIFDLGSTYHDYEQGVDLLKEALELDPDNYLLLYRLGRGHLLQGDVLPEEERLEVYEKGREYVERAKELAPDSADSLYWYAAILGRIGQTRGILQSLFMVKPIHESLERVLELDPEYASAYFVLSILYMEAPRWPISIGNKDKSLEYALRSVALEPKNYDFLYNLAVVYIDNNQKEKAQVTLEELLLLEEAQEDQEKREEVLALLSSL